MAGRGRHSKRGSRQRSQGGEAPGNPRQPKPSLLRDGAKRWTTVVGTLATGLLTWGVAVLTGGQPLPGRVPILEFLRNQPILAGTVTALVVATTAAAWLIAHHEGGVARTATTPPNRRSFLTALIATSTTSTAMLASLTALVILQPSWCPPALCSPVLGPHDQNLELGFTAIQSSAFVLPADLGAVTLANMPTGSLPHSVAAQRVLGEPLSAADPGYGLALRIHSLQQGRFGMVIEGVALIVTRKSPLPDNLRVLDEGASLIYHTNPFHVTYSGQSVGQVLTATFVGPRPGHVQLSPGEVDELTLQVSSSVAVDLSFRVRIVYRLVTESTDRYLDTPGFRVTYSDQLNWQRFQMRDGQVVPAE